MSEDKTILRMIGESYKLYAERMYGRARAAERDRDEQAVYIKELEGRLDAIKWSRGAVSELEARKPPERRFSAGA